MPIYEYRCTSCHHQFEIIQKINDAHATQCPKCFEETVERLVSAPGFQLKGTGWYATDFKNKGKPEIKDKAPASGDSKPVDSKSDSSAESKSDKDKDK